jgi:hypothetical protein
MFVASKSSLHLRYSAPFSFITIFFNLVSRVLRVIDVVNIEAVFGSSMGCVADVGASAAAGAGLVNSTPA